MTKWEYLVLNYDNDYSASDVERDLDDYGVKGWEVVSCTVRYADIFVLCKRSLAADNPNEGLKV